MSALGQKQTSSRQIDDVRFTPKADISERAPPCPLCARSGHRPAYSITSSARASSLGGTSILSAQAHALPRLHRNPRPAAALRAHAGDLSKGFPTRLLKRTEIPKKLN